MPASRLVEMILYIAKYLLNVILLPMIVIATLPPIQRLLVYMHWINFPLKDLSNPIQFGYRSKSARCVQITTEDRVCIGAWHLVSGHKPNNSDQSHEQRDHLHRSLEEQWIVQPNELVYLYFHGNAGNRATQHRRAFYQTMLTGHMRATRNASRSHILAVDYRGFGDSDSVLPTENGLIMDAIAAWRYIVQDLNASPDQVVIVGHSLGTGVASALVSRHLIKANQIPRGLILLAPFTSIPNAAFEYPWVPLWVLGETVKSWLMPLVSEKWPVIDYITQINCHTLIIHGNDDCIVPHYHSRSLFTKGTGHSILTSDDFSSSIIGDKITTTRIPNEGTIFKAPFGSSLNSATKALCYAEINSGGHDNLHEFAITRDVIANWISSLLPAAK